MCVVSLLRACPGGIGVATETTAANYRLIGWQFTWLGCRQDRSPGLPADATGFAVAAALAGQDHTPMVVLTSSRDRRDLELLLRTSPAQGFIEKERLSADTPAALLA